MSLTILVTGGAGYIGTHTAVALVEAGFRVVLLDNFSNSEFSAVQAMRSLVAQEVPFYEADCRNKNDLLNVFNTEKEQGFPILGVIHFAALKAVGESVAKPELYKSNNIGGTECLLETMQEFGVHSLVFSSVVQCMESRKIFLLMNYLLSCLLNRLMDIPNKLARN